MTAGAHEHVLSSITAHLCAWSTLIDVDCVCHRGSCNVPCRACIYPAKLSRWDDLPAEARREAVSRTHNVVFSQLASIAFNMLECGVDGARVRTDVTRKCRESQLGEAQVSIHPSIHPSHRIAWLELSDASLAPPTLR